MKTLVFILILTFVSLPLFGGEIYVVKTKGDADVIVYLTEYSYEADIYVSITEVGTYAKKCDYYWMFVKYKLPSVIKVYYTQYKYEADVIVFFSTYNAGWKKSNVFNGRLH